MNFDLDDFQLELEEKVLEYILDKKFFGELENAKNLFFGQQDKEESRSLVNVDFNKWLIYDFKMKQGTTFVQCFYNDYKNHLNPKEKETMEQIINSYPSLFELKEFKKNHGLYKDVFKNTEFIIDGNAQTQMQVRDLVFARIVKINNHYKFFGDKVYMPGFLKSSIERNIIARYEDYRAQNQYATWDNFLDNNRLLIYQHIGIITQVVNSEMEEEEDKYQVWQSIYLIRDIKKIKQIFLEHDSIQFELEEYEAIYFKILEGGSILAELILMNNRCELECTSERDRKKSKKIVEEVLGNLVTHYKDEIIGLNDII